MTGDHTRWAISWPCDRAMELASPTAAEPDDEGHIGARVLLSARCEEPQDSEGKDALCIGVYDEVNDKVLFSRVLKNDELAGKDYRIIDLGTLPLGRGTTFWAEPREGGAKNVYIDRIAVIRE